MKKIFFVYILFLFAVLPVVTSAAYSQYFGNKLWGVDSDVNAIAEGPDGTIYVGGWFTEVGQYVGHGFPVTADGDIDIPKLKPVVDNFGDGVTTVISDGDDGWYIGGHFQAVGDVTVSNVAHILKTGEIDENFITPEFDDEVLTLLLDGTTLYVGGSFVDVGGTTRNHLAAFDTTTGALTSFDPDIDGDVWTFSIEGATLYVGGQFTTVNGGTTRNYLAAFDTTTGTATSFDPDMNNTVFAIESSGTTLYAGGSFTTVNGGTTRNRLAAFALPGGTLTAFNPGASNSVYDIDLFGETLYVTGSFSTLAGQTRNLAGAINTTTGDVTSFDPDLTGLANEIVLYGTTAYIGGSMSGINGGADSRYFAAFDASSGVVGALDLELNDYVNALAVDDDGTVYIGGNFYFAHTEPQEYVAAFDPDTGEPKDFDLGLNNGVETLLVDDSTLYVGGYFTSVNGGTTRNRLAAFDTTTGTATSFDPNIRNTAGGSVDTLALDGTTLYVGGSFNSVNGNLSRYRLAAIDTTTGVATSFDPSMNNQVLDIELDGTTLYAAGFFTQVNSTTTPVARNRIAAIDIATGLPTSWNPGVVGNYILQLELTDTSVFAGGQFSSVGGDTRYALAEIDKVTASSTAFSIAGLNSNAQMQSLSERDGIMYGNASTNPYYGITGFDISTSANVLDFDVDWDSGWASLATDEYLYFAGEIPTLLGRIPLSGEEDYIEGLPLSVEEEPPAEEEEEDSGGGSSGSRRRCGEQHGLPTCTPTTTPSTATTTEPAQQDPANVTLEQLQTQLIELLKQLLQILLTQQQS